MTSLVAPDNSRECSSNTELKTQLNNDCRFRAVPALCAWPHDAGSDDVAVVG